LGGSTLTEIFGMGPILAAKIIATGETTWHASLLQGSLRFLLSGTAPVEASSSDVVRYRLSSLAGNRHLNNVLHMRSPSVRPGRTLGAEPTTARSSRRANPIRRGCGASRGAS
jgi:Transposase IS116/IS110/IS902 family